MKFGVKQLRQESDFVPVATTVNTNSITSCPRVRAASRVSLPQVARVLSEVYGDRMASQSGGGSEGESFPLQQKLLVCCLLLLIRNGKSKEVGLGKVRHWTGNWCLRWGSSARCCPGELRLNFRLILVFSMKCWLVVVKFVIWFCFSYKESIK